MTTELNEDGERIASAEITARDYFAAKALAAIISKSPHLLVERGSVSKECASAAYGAYLYADAMLKARQS